MPKLVNLGSMCIDNVYRVDHISASGETLSSKSYEIFPGGKGLNQSLAAARAGADVVHVGCVGNDGVWLRDLLEDAHVDVDHVRVGEGRTGHAVIQVDDAGQNAIVIVGGTNREITDVDIANALNKMEKADWLLLQNEINELEKVLAAAYERGANVALNVAPVDGRESGYDLSGLSALIVNEVEAEALTGINDPHESLRNLCERYPTTQVILTLGKDGLRYGFKEMRLAIDAFAVDAVDETAAGDTFIGYLIASMLRGEPMEDSLVLASGAGALAVTTAGAASSIPLERDVRRFIENIIN